MSGIVSESDKFHRPPEIPPEFWIASLYVAAFLRVAISLFIAGNAILSGSAVKIGTISLNAPGLFVDVVILTGLGIASYKRQLWAGYGLILHAALDTSSKLIAQDFTVGFGSLLWIAIFVTGTVHLFRSKSFTSPIRLDIRFILRWVAVLVLIGVVLIGGLPAFFASFYGLTWRPSQSPIIGIFFFGFVLLSQILAATHKRQWSLEHILCVAILYLGVVAPIELLIGRGPQQLLGGSYYLFGLTFLAWGLSQKLESRAPSAERIERSLKKIGALCGVLGLCIWVDKLLVMLTTPHTWPQWAVFFGLCPLFFLIPWGLIRLIEWLIREPSALREGTGTAVP